MREANGYFSYTSGILRRCLGEEVLTDVSPCSLSYSKGSGHMGGLYLDHDGNSARSQDLFLLKMLCSSNSFQRSLS